MVMLAGLVVTGCAGESAAPAPAPAPTIAIEARPDAPFAPTGANDDATALFEHLIETIPTGLFDVKDLNAFIDAGDARHAWLLTDLMRFIRDESAMALSGLPLS